MLVAFASAPANLFPWSAAHGQKEEFWTHFIHFFLVPTFGAEYLKGFKFNHKTLIAFIKEATLAYEDIHAGGTRATRSCKSMGLPYLVLGGKGFLRKHEKGVSKPRTTEQKKKADMKVQEQAVALIKRIAKKMISQRTVAQTETERAGSPHCIKSFP